MSTVQQPSTSNDTSNSETAEPTGLPPKPSPPAQPTYTVVVTNLTDTEAIISTESLPLLSNQYPGFKDYVKHTHLDATPVVMSPALQIMKQTGKALTDISPIGIVCSGPHDTFGSYAHIELFNRMKQRVTDLLTGCNVIPNDIQSITEAQTWVDDSLNLALFPKTDLYYAVPGNKNIQHAVLRIPSEITTSLRLLYWKYIRVTGSPGKWNLVYETDMSTDATDMIYKGVYGDTIDTLRSDGNEKLRIDAFGARFTPALYNEKKTYINDEELRLVGDSNIASHSNVLPPWTKMLLDVRNMLLFREAKSCEEAMMLFIERLKTVDPVYAKPDPIAAIHENETGPEKKTGPENETAADVPDELEKKETVSANVKMEDFLKKLQSKPRIVPSNIEFTDEVLGLSLNIFDKTHYNPQQDGISLEQRISSLPVPSALFNIFHNVSSELVDEHTTFSPLIPSFVFQSPLAVLINCNRSPLLPLVTTWMETIRTYLTLINGVYIHLRTAEEVIAEENVSAQRLKRECKAVGDTIGASVSTAPVVEKSIYSTNTIDMTSSELFKLLTDALDEESRLISEWAQKTDNLYKLYQFNAEHGRSAEPLLLAIAELMHLTVVHILRRYEDVIMCMYSHQFPSTQCKNVYYTPFAPPSPRLVSPYMRRHLAHKTQNFIVLREARENIKSPHARYKLDFKTMSLTAHTDMKHDGACIDRYWAWFCKRFVSKKETTTEPETDDITSAQPNLLDQLVDEYTKVEKETREEVYPEKKARVAKLHKKMSTDAKRTCEMFFRSLNAESFSINNLLL